jgi:hypothetical protein
MILTDRHGINPSLQDKRAVTNHLSLSKAPKFKQQMLLGKLTLTLRV